MAAMPAHKLSEFDRPMEKAGELSPLIDAVAYYQELAFEYPTTHFYRRMLEAAQGKLKEAEKKLSQSQRRL
jgi:hypothetical protein